MLQQLLPLIWQQLQKILLDAQSGTRSRHGFRAFFKTNKAIKPVRRIFEDIANNKAVTVSADRAARLGTATATPRFACLKQGDAATAHLLEECRRRPTVPLWTWGATEIIMVCPGFFSLPAALTVESCPKVVGNKLTPDDDTLVASMFGTIIHELVHIYHPVTANFREGIGDVEEVYDVQKAVELSAQKSLKNANNFALYAAGE